MSSLTRSSVSPRRSAGRARRGCARARVALLGELRDNFLTPLRGYLDGALSALRQRVSTRKTSDDRDNEYEFWPARNDHSVPRKYAPAPNERLLVEHTAYPAEFERLVRATVEGDRKYQDAVIEVLVEMLVGKPPRTVAEADAATWALIANPRSWKPSVTADASAKLNTQTPHFQMATDPEVYLERARVWMRREGTPFHAYITEDLLSFFDETEVTPGEFAKRRDRYREQLQSALGASEPLVKLNPSLLRSVHDKAINEGTSLVFSSIPFREGTEMHAVTKGVLGQMGFWDDATSDGWFQDARVDGIEVFAMSGFPVPADRDGFRDGADRARLAPGVEHAAQSRGVLEVQARAPPRRGDPRRTRRHHVHDPRLVRGEGAQPT